MLNISKRTSKSRTNFVTLNSRYALSFQKYYMLKSNSILITDNNECNEHIYGYFEGTFTIIMNKISKKYLDSYGITNSTVLYFQMHVLTLFKFFLIFLRIKIFGIALDQCSQPFQMHSSNQELKTVLLSKFLH